MFRGWRVDRGHKGEISYIYSKGELMARDRQIAEYGKKVLNPKSYKYAEAFALSRVAFEANEKAKKTVTRTMIVKNKWTLGSMRYQKATPKRLQAEFGSSEKYMEKQEFGARVRSKGKYGVVVPTAQASGEGGTPRRKLVKAANSMRRVKLEKTKKATSEYGKGFAQARKGAKYVFMYKGIYTVKGKKYKKRTRVHSGSEGKVLVKAKFTKIYDLENKTTRIRKRPWMRESAEYVMSKRIERIYAEEILKQLKRAR